MVDEFCNNALVIIKDVRNILVEGSSIAEEYKKKLIALGQLVTLSSQSQEFRDRIAFNDDTPHVLIEILKNSLDDNIPTNESTFELYIRLMRGVLLLARNLVITNQFIDYGVLLSNLQRFNHKLKPNHEFYSKTIVVYVQCLANMSNTSQDKSIVSEIVQTIFNNKDLMLLIKEDDQVKLPFAIFLKNALQNPNNLYEIMTYDDTILKYIINEFENVDVHSEELNQYTSLLILAFQIIITHESYNKWLSKTDFESDEFLKIMKLNQIIVTSKEDWDNYQLTAMLAWILDNFKFFSDESKKVLVSNIYDPIQLKRLHLNLIILLDCLSDLGKFEATKQFLEHYNAIEEFISLLKVVHENIERKTLKNKEKIELVEDKKEFPQVKSLIIEIIAYLVHGSFEMQEKVRELHGLELVLSNCMIDDNDPFIKERAIVCVKFLLANNQKNQQFVADLEAKQTIDDNELRQVGYEVQIEDGKVKLKQNEQFQQNNTK